MFAGMDIATLKSKIEAYNAREHALRAQLEAATSDALRFEIEHMLRLTQVAALSFLQQAEQELEQKTATEETGEFYREQTGDARHPSVRGARAA